MHTSKVSLTQSAGAHDGQVRVNVLVSFPVLASHSHAPPTNFGISQAVVAAIVVVVDVVVAVVVVVVIVVVVVEVAAVVVVVVVLVVVVVVCTHSPTEIAEPTHSFLIGSTKITLSLSQIFVYSCSLSVHGPDGIAGVQEAHLHGRPFW